MTRFDGETGVVPGATDGGRRGGTARARVVTTARLRSAGRSMEPAGGIEPSTCCLQDSCSAN